MDIQLDYQSNFLLPERQSHLPTKLLIGAGPTNPSPRVILALSNPTVGAHCPELYQLMDDIQCMLRYTFQTKNEITLALQTSGTGGLEAVLCNLVDPGERVIVAVSGYWGVRIVEKAKSRNADVIRIDSAIGDIFTLEELEKEVSKFRPVVLFVTHGESSSGTLQNLEGLGKMCHKYDCLLAVDAVVTLAGVPFYTDRWEIDVAVAGSQKALGAPAGMALITMSPKAVDKMRRIKCLPPFYYNIVETCRQWNLLHERRFYYVTYNSHLLSAVREALIEVVEEGLIKRWERHRKCVERFWSGVDKVGISVLNDRTTHRLTTVNCCLPPPGVASIDVIKFLFDKYQVEPGIGIAPYSPNCLRIGFMGYNARPEVVDYTLKVVEEAIEHCKTSTQCLNKQTV